MNTPTGEQLSRCATEAATAEHALTAAERLVVLEVVAS